MKENKNFGLKHPEDNSKASKKIIIYSTPACHYCHVLKDYLDSHGIDYIDIDISMNHDALHEMIHKSKLMITPVIDINGEIIIGFDKDKIDRILGLN